MTRLQPAQSDGKLHEGKTEKVEFGRLKRHTQLSGRNKAHLNYKVGHWTFIATGGLLRKATDSPNSARALIVYRAGRQQEYVPYKRPQLSNNSGSYARSGTLQGHAGG